MDIVEIFYFKNEILPKLKDYFPSCVINEKKSSSNKIIFRLNIETKDEAENFKTVLSEVTNTAWIVYSRTSDLR